SSLTVRSPSTSRSRIARRVASARAAKVRSRLGTGIIGGPGDRYFKYMLNMTDRAIGGKGKHRPVRDSLPCCPKTTGAGVYRLDRWPKREDAMDEAKQRATAQWLIDGARSTAEPAAVLAELCDRLVEGGVPLARAGVFVRTLHPQLLGRSFIWSLGKGA